MTAYSWSRLLSFTVLRPEGDQCEPDSGRDLTVSERGGSRKGVSESLVPNLLLERAKISRYPESRRVTPHTAPKYFLPGWHAQGTSGLRLALRQSSQWRGPGY